MTTSLRGLLLDEGTIEYMTAIMKTATEVARTVLGAHE